MLDKLITMAEKYNGASETYAQSQLWATLEGREAGIKEVAKAVEIARRKTRPIYTHTAAVYFTLESYEIDVQPADLIEACRKRLDYLANHPADAAEAFSLETER